jgi:signal peptidase II
LRILFVTLVVVFADQLTKLLIKGLKIESLGINFQGMQYGSSKPLIGNIVRLTFIENPGMAFGIDVGPKMFLTIFTIIASVFIFFYIYKHRNDGILIRLSLSLILAGAVGNLIDRTFYGMIYDYAPLFHGKVVDFVQIEFWDFTIMGRTYTTWPIFNIADVAVSAGFIIILLFHNKIFTPDKPPEAPETANRDIPLELEHSGAASLSADSSYISDTTISDTTVSDSNIENPVTENNIKEDSIDNSPAINNSNGGFITDNSQITLKDKANLETQKFYSEDTKKNVDSGPGGADETKN